MSRIQGKRSVVKMLFHLRFPPTVPLNESSNNLLDHDNVGDGDTGAEDPDEDENTLGVLETLPQGVQDGHIPYR